jgi:hypothetical protein
VLGQPFPNPKTGSTEVRYTADGSALGVGAGSTISGYEIAGIGHGVHMCLVSLSRFGLSRIGLRAGLLLPQRLSKGKVMHWTLRLAASAAASSMSVGLVSARGGQGLRQCLALLNAPRAALSTHIAGQPFRL